MVAAPAVDLLITERIWCTVRAFACISSGAMRCACLACSGVLNDHGIEVFIPPATQIALSALAFVLLIAFVRVGCRRYDGGESEVGI